MRLQGFAAQADLALTDSIADAKTIVRITNDPSFANDPVALALLPEDVTVPRDNPEAYAITIAKDSGLTHITLAARTSEGIRMASRTLVQLWEIHKDAQPPVYMLYGGGIVDWPACPVRGAIEGFYGEPWTPEARAGMIRFLGAHKFNTFVYGPKDDVYHRGLWREPYPEDKFAAVAEQIALCDAEGLRFVYSLGPGLDLQYSSDADVQQILAKYRRLFDAGVRHFGLYFDDIPFVFLNDADVPVYGEATPDDITPLGVAQAEVTTKVFAALRAWDANCSLIFCPVEYWGDCESGYVRALRDGLPPDVDVFYTGPDVCSAKQETEHTRRISERFGRPVIFWDNYPVNDVGMSGRLHINPIVGRDPDLFTAARGLISNPMPQCEASKIALGSIASYLWAPETYDALYALHRTLYDVVDSDEVPHMERFAQNMHFCCLHETESELLGMLMADVRAGHGTPDGRAAARKLLALVQEVTMAARALAQLSNEALREEMAPWVRALDRWMDVARAAVGVLQCPAERRAAERKRLTSGLKQMAGVKEEVCGPVVAAFARWVLEQTA